MDGYRLKADESEFFASYDEVHESFDAMGLQEKLLRGIYAYGRYIIHACLFDSPFVLSFDFIWLWKTNALCDSF